TPFHRRWLELPRRPVLPAPSSLPSPPGGASEMPRLADLGLQQEVPEPAPGGERSGRAALDRFLARTVEGYDEGRDRLDADGVSRLSPYLHFGCVSPREIEHGLKPGPG